MKKKAKKKTTSQLKKELDRLFSIYIRKKHTNEKEEVRCYTCGVTKHWKDMQNGHLVSRSYLATRYDENNVRPQCVGCNVFGGGRIAVFASKIDEELGKGTVARLYKKAQEITKYFPYEKEIERYKNLIEKLL